MSFPGLILYICGFSVHENVYEAFKKQKVGIFPHTSRFEAFIGCMGFWASGNRKNICFPVAENYMNMPIIGSSLAYFGGVKKVKGSGMTKLISDHMKEFPNKCLMISPEGSLSAKEWHSGFFYIAKECGAPIIVAGIDFVNHQLYANLDKEIIVSPDDKYEDKVEEIKKMFEESKVYPLYPNQSNPIVKMEPGMVPRILPLSRMIAISFVILVLTIGIYFADRYI